VVSFTPGESAPGTYWIGGWVGFRAILDVEGEEMLPLPGLELRPLGRPARSQSLYRLSYPGSQTPHRIPTYVYYLFLLKSIIFWDMTPCSP
jgi:hypothetical protein